MTRRTILHSLALMLLLCATITAQEAAAPPADKSKEEEQKAQAELERKALVLLEETIDGAQFLKLPENRCLILATAADLLWPHDEKRARGFFQDALVSLADAMKSVTTDGMRQDDSLWFFIQMRQQILGQVARRDPQLALDLMHTTRQVFTENLPSYARMMDQELALEQSIAAEVAAKDPKRALQMAEESLAKGVSYQAMHLLRQLQAKDSEAASSFAGEIIKKLGTTDFARNPQAAMVAQQLLRTLIQKDQNGSGATTESASKIKPLTVDDATTRDLTDLVINAAMNSSSDQPAFMMLQPLLPELEKRAPERVAQLRRKLTENAEKTNPQYKMMMQYEMLMRDGKTDDLLAAAAKAPPDMSVYLYQTAVSKLVQSGDLERARKVASDNLTGEGHDQWLALIDRKLIEKALKENKTEEARKLLERITPKEARLAQIANMALNLFQQGDGKTALALMKETEELVNRPPDNQGELNAMLQVARAYAIIEPARAYGVIEPVLDTTNTLLAAAVVLEKFGADRGYFRDGEFRLQSSLNSKYYPTQYRKELNALVRADFKRARALADRLQRDEVRLMARLLIAYSVLAKPSESDGNSVSNDWE